MRRVTPPHAAPPRVTPPHGDQGSTIPLVLLCFLVVLLLVAGVTAASAAFLAQRELQADCDGAALAAASGVDPGAVYRGELSRQEVLPLARQQAQWAVNSYQAKGFPGDPSLAMRADVNVERVTVVCRRVVRIPFGALFGAAKGLDRLAVSTARSPLLRGGNGR